MIVGVVLANPTQKRSLNFGAASIYASMQP